MALIYFIFWPLSDIRFITVADSYGKSFQIKLIWTKKHIEINFRNLINCAWAWGGILAMFPIRIVCCIPRRGTLNSILFTFRLRFISLNLRRLFLDFPSASFALSVSLLDWLYRLYTLLSSSNIFFFKQTKIDYSSLVKHNSGRASRGSTSVSNFKGELHLNAELRKSI